MIQPVGKLLFMIILIIIYSSNLAYSNNDVNAYMKME